MARRHEVQAQKDPRAKQHDERVEGDLADQEGPVVREDLVEQLPARTRDSEPRIEPVVEGVNHCPAPSSPVLLARRNRSGRGSSPLCRYKEGAGATAAGPARRSAWRGLWRGTAIG